MLDQTAKATAFRALHEKPGAFLLPNPWDVGTARLLASLGFEALATTSFGLANMNGCQDVTKAETMENCRLLCEATPLPVNADLENGFGPSPQDAADTIRLASECGVAGGSIEDFSGDPKAPIYDFHHAVERVQASVEMARSLAIPFVFTARAENLIRGVMDLDDTIKRLQAFEKVGAEVLYAPGLKTIDDMRQVIAEINRPLNVVMGFADPSITLAELTDVGVKRVSVGGALSRVALQCFMDCARDMQAGRFDFIEKMMPVSDLHGAFPSVDD